MSSPINLTEDPEDNLPPNILEDWLPIRNKSVFHLFTFNHYPVYKTHYLVPPDLGPVSHEEEVPDFDHTTLLQLGLPVNTSILYVYQAAIKSTQHMVHSVTIKPYPGLGEPIILPVWIFDYWRKIESAAEYQKKWKVALKWLQSYLAFPATASHCQELLMALSFFPWSGNNTSVKHITSLLSSSNPQSYLHSFHVDHMIGHVLTQYHELHGPEVSGRHIFMTVDALGEIAKSYSSSGVSTKTRDTLQKHHMEIENQIVKGEVDSVSGVYHLPLHWVSIVIDVQQGHILYDDSLKKSMPRLERNEFTKWIQCLYHRSNRSADSVSVHPLATGYQDNVTSCGLFALNAISHHHLGHPLLSPNQLSVALM